MLPKLVLCCLLVALGACGVGSATPCADVECGPGASCSDSSGPALCRCDPGYDDPAGDGTSCVDIDECATGQVECPGETVCQNRPGTYAAAARMAIDDRAGSARRTMSARPAPIRRYRGC